LRKLQGQRPLRACSGEAEFGELKGGRLRKSIRDPQCSEDRANDNRNPPSFLFHHVILFFLLCP
jgi:hypothetical protein